MGCEFKKCPLYYPCLETLDESPPCATENCGTQPTDVQQLKAEIAAIMHELEDDISGRGTNVKYQYLIERLRQLSAV